MPEPEATILEPQARKKMRQQRLSNDPDWAGGLPKDILDLILDKFLSLGDYIYFGAICTVWRSVVLDDYKSRNQRKRRFWQKSQQQLPLLLLPPQAMEVNSMGVGSCLYSITKQEVLGNHTRPLVYCRTSKRFIGSSLGWLIFIDTNNKINLFNPFREFDTSSNRKDDSYTGDGTNIRIQHLCMDHIFDNYLHGLVNIDFFIAKAVLSADPMEHPDDYILALIYGRSRRLVLLKPSLRRAWYPDIMKVDDVIYHSSSTSFYVAIIDGPIVSASINELDIDHGVSIETVGPESPPSLYYRTFRYYPDFYPSEERLHREYIVENSSGNILKVYHFVEYLGMTNFTTSHFCVYKFSRDKGCWDELKSLGDEVLFLGDNSSISIQASNFLGCRSGAIYYSFYMSQEDPISANGSMDMGVFQLETRKFYPFNIHLTSRWSKAMVKQPPIWVVPTIQMP